MWRRARRVDVYRSEVYTVTRVLCHLFQLFAYGADPWLSLLPDVKIEVYLINYYGGTSCTGAWTPSNSIFKW